VNILNSSVNRIADQALDALRALSGTPLLPGVSGSDFLTQRSCLMDLKAEGQRSANGSCHLWPCLDGKWIALNLSRPQDWELLPALFQQNQTLSHLQEVAERISQYPADMLLSRGRTLGLAIGIAFQGQHRTNKHWCSTTTSGPQRQSSQTSPLVLDLSALWAGPLCSYLLKECGAHVIKIESRQRPDGSRLNPRAGAKNFYQQLNNDKELHVLDFHSTEDLKTLEILIEKADIVIESSRPRALQQLGIRAEKIVTTAPGKIWLSITGYGRSEPEANWIAYGDDAAIGAGLCHWNNGKPEFIGDAIADPLTGLHAALAAYHCWQKKSSVLLDINLHDVSRYCAWQAGY
jgi:crotonobetainyl-CoA:carnitine CoA-transferase CaiB-like acyl-CoA transferase